MANVLLATVSQLKALLHIDYDDDDDQLELELLAASRVVIRYLKGDAAEILGIGSPPESPPDNFDAVPSDISYATTVLAAYFHRNPDNDDDGAFEGGKLPRAVRALLHPYRLPTLE